MKFLSLGIKYIQSNHVKERAGQFADSNDKKHTKNKVYSINTEFGNPGKDVKTKGLW